MRMALRGRTCFVLVLAVMVTLFTVVYSQAPGGLDFDQLLGGGGNKQQSSGFKCRAGQKAVQIPGKAVQSNGCSKPQGIQVPGEEDFSYCCDRHDACYATCGLTQNYCDEDFGTCMKSLCKSTFAHNPACPEAAGMYKMGTALFGQASFAESQADHCTCVDADSFTAHYSGLVAEFYEKFVDTTAARSSTLVEDLIAMPKWAGEKLRKLYYTLHKKYDHAIELTGAMRVAKKDIPRPVVKDTNKKKQEQRNEDQSKQEL